MEYRLHLKVMSMFGAVYTTSWQPYETDEDLEKVQNELYNLVGSVPDVINMQLESGSLIILPAGVIQNTVFQVQTRDPNCVAQDTHVYEDYHTIKRDQLERVEKEMAMGALGTDKIAGIDDLIKEFDLTEGDFF